MIGVSIGYGLSARRMPEGIERQQMERAEDNKRIDRQRTERIEDEKRSSDSGWSGWRTTSGIG